MGAATMSDTSWYYARGEEQVGPVDESQLKQLVDDGSLYPDDLVWRDGMADWVEAREIPELYGSETAYYPQEPPVQSAPGSQPQQSPAEGAVPSHPTYAGFWQRVLAFIIDALIITAASGIVGLGVDLDFDWEFWEQQNGIQIVVLWLYYALMESSKWQATVGKMALGLRVTEDSGAPLSFGRASGRFFAKYLSAIALIGFIMIAFTQKKQGLHDMIAGSVVVEQK